MPRNNGQTWYSYAQFQRAHFIFQARIEKNANLAFPITGREKARRLTAERGIRFLVVECSHRALELHGIPLAVSPWFRLREGSLPCQRC